MGLSLSAVLEVGARRAESETAPWVAVVDDDAAVASLAVEVCRGVGVRAAAFPSTAPLLDAVRDGALRAVVLDWRLEREVGSAALMAIRHAFPRLPVICWTGSSAAELPAMVHDDPATRLVSKAAGAAALEAAIRWALAQHQEESNHDGGIQGPQGPAFGRAG